MDTPQVGPSVRGRKSSISQWRVKDARSLLRVTITNRRLIFSSGAQEGEAWDPHCPEKLLRPWCRALSRV